MNDALRLEASPRSSAVRKLLTLLAVPLFVVAALLLTPQTASAQFGNVTLADTPVSGSSGATPGTMLTWPHTVPDSANRLLVVTISIHRTAGVTPNVNSITFGAQALTGIVAATGNSQDNSKRTEIWVLVAPTIGAGTITVTLSAPGNVVGASYSFASVDQAAPVFNAGNNAAINTPSSAAAVLAICPSAFAQSAIVDVVAVEATLTATPAASQMNVQTQVTSDPNVGDRLLGRGGDIDPPAGQFNVMQYNLSGNDFWVMSTLTLNPAALTGVGLQSFDATSYDGLGPNGRTGGVSLTWRSGAESNNLGYRIYRDRDGVRTPVTNGLIAGSTLFTGDVLSSGYRYGWYDADGRVGDRYFLEDVDSSGRGTLHGPYATWQGSGKSPIEANSPTLSDLNRPSAGSRMVWSEESAKAVVASAKGGGNAPGGPNAQWQLANAPAIKIGVRDTGWYRVTPATLASAGINLGSVDPRSLRVYTGGREIPIRVSGEADGRFDAGDSIEFFNAALDVQSTDVQVFWLTAAAGNGQRMKVQNTRATTGSPLSYPAVAELKERFVYFASLANGERENFFGQVVSAEQADHTLTLNKVDPAGTGGILEVSLQGVTYVPHHVTVLVNGQAVGGVDFTNKNAGVARLTVPQSALLEGANVVSLVNAAGSDPASVSLVDTIRLSYTHRAVADGNLAVVNITGRSGARTIDGFTSNQIRAYDVTNPASVQEVAGPVSRTANGFGITVQPGTTSRRLLVLTPDQALAPVSITVNRPSSWNAATNGADVVYITHRDFAGSLASLKALRESQGYRVAVVDVEDLYDEFTFGVESPQAIRSFLVQARATWSKAPAFVTLVGDGTLDPKNYLGGGDLSFIPSKLIDAASVELASDDWMADTNGNDLPDVAIGRLPVRTADEATALAAKIVAYESAGTANRSAMLVADVNDISDFEQTSADIHALLPSDFAVTTVSRSVEGDASARQLVLAGASSGPGIVNFVGHGAIDMWRGNLLSSADAGTLGNAGRLSVYVSGNCLNGYFQDPFLESLGEALLKAPNGAVAVWASSGATGPEGQRPLLGEFYRSLFAGQPITLGQAAAQSKSAAAGDVRRSWVLLGDAATRLH